jgi:hypothetical protein
VDDDLREFLAKIVQSLDGIEEGIKGLRRQVEALDNSVRQQGENICGHIMMFSPDS